MSDDDAFVFVQIGQGGSLSPTIVGKLVHENGHPFVELPADSDPDLPRKMALVQSSLVLESPPSPGRRAFYRHKTVLARP